MARHRYDDPYRDRQQWEREVLRPDWGRPHPSDPNWADGTYRGMRSGGGSWQAPYERHRRDREADLRRWGGYLGRYGRPMGGFRPDGLLAYEDRRRERREPPPRYGGEYRQDPEWQGGGVRDDIGYLRQYNSRSPGLRYGADYSQGYGWAERARHGNAYPDDGPTRERSYAGYNQAGWAAGTWPGPGSRASQPNR